ncbi:MAG: alpha/beta fold hydrolase [Actinobacteria bacterium]|nr:alpha/beta fold hydrolase [Actinomycetota bacterium]MBW3650828.1 alpha/beta fold hydrolase [Actinomycetota bacterium]
MLHFDVHGRAGHDRRVVLVHGFTQTRRSWDPLLEPLAADHQVLAVDAPGHGLSSHYRVGLWEAARLLGEAGNEASYLGYSMGARLVLHLALAAPYLVRRVVLVGATAGIADERERVARLAADEVLAAGLEKDGIESFLRRWLSSPLFETLTPEAAGMEARRENTVEGLAAALRLLGTGAQEPLWDRLGSLHMPALLLAGERDDKFTRLAERMAECWGGPAEVVVVAGAGHAAHLEQPGRFLDAVLPFLDGDHRTATPPASSNP